MSIKGLPLEIPLRREEVVLMKKDQNLEDIEKRINDFAEKLISDYVKTNAIPEKIIERKPYKLKLKRLFDQSGGISLKRTIEGQKRQLKDFENWVAPSQAVRHIINEDSGKLY